MSTSFHIKSFSFFALVAVAGCGDSSPHFSGDTYIIQAPEITLDNHFPLIIVRARAGDSKAYYVLNRKLNDSSDGLKLEAGPWKSSTRPSSIGSLAYTNANPDGNLIGTFELDYKGEPTITSFVLTDLQEMKFKSDGRLDREAFETEQYSYVAGKSISKAEAIEFLRKLSSSEGEVGTFDTSNEEVCREALDLSCAEIYGK